jgi:hypothetical protein
MKRRNKRRKWEGKAKTQKKKTEEEKRRTWWEEGRKCEGRQRRGNFGV